MFTDSNTSGGFPALSGGVPTKSQDFAASIIFAFAFAIILIPAAYRLLRSESKSAVLIRPTIFAIAQTVAYVLRAILADGHGSEKLFEVSEILLLAGLTLICEPIPALLSRRLGGWKKGRALSNEVPLLVQRALGLLRVAVTIALILGVIAASDISDNESASTKQSIKTYRTANAAIILAAMALTALLALSQAKTGLLTTRSVFWTCAQCFLLVVTAAYKLINVLHPADNYSLSCKIIFYIFNALIDWMAAIMFFAFNLNPIFPFPDTNASLSFPPGAQNQPLRQNQTMMHNKPQDRPSQQYQQYKSNVMTHQYPPQQQSYGVQQSFPNQGFPPARNQRTSNSPQV